MAKKYLIIFTFFLTLIFISTSSFASVIINNNYPVNTSPVQSPVEFNNSTNLQNLFSTEDFNNNTSAISNITSVWPDTSYSDSDYSVVANTFGSALVYNHTSSLYYPIGSPYNDFNYSGPITGIAGASDYDSTGNPIFIELSYQGHIFYYYDNTWGVFNVILPGNGWVSLTANAYGESICGYSTYFIATNINGTAYAWDSDTGYYYIWNEIPSQYPIISTVAGALETSNSCDCLYGLSYSGNVMLLTSSGWQPYGNVSTHDDVSISISFCGYYCQYLYVLSEDNNTSLSVSNNAVSGSTSNTFTQSSGNIDHSGTNEALSIWYNSSSCTNSFYAYQTNGTALVYNSTSSSADITSFDWSVMGTHILTQTYTYSKILYLDDDTANTYYALLDYSHSINISNINSISVYFNNSEPVKEFSYYNSIINSTLNGVKISESVPVLVNMSILPNNAHNTTIYFKLVYYNANKSIYLFYDYKINIINKFSWWS
ncbi:MAG: hypothetical protein QXZ44_06870 [Ferroplasma sp.]